MVSGRTKVYEFIAEARFEQSQSLLGMVQSMQATKLQGVTKNISI